MEFGSIVILFVGLYSSASGVRPGDNNSAGQSSNRGRNLIAVEDPRQRDAHRGGGNFRISREQYQTILAAILPIFASATTGTVMDQASLLSSGIVTDQGKITGLITGVAIAAANVILQQIIRYRNRNNQPDEPPLVQSIINELTNARIPLSANVERVTTDLVNRVNDMIDGVGVNAAVQPDNEHD